MANQNKVPLSDALGEIKLDFDGICRFCLTETQDGISVNDERLYEESKGLKSESVYNFMTKLRIIEVKYFKDFPAKICGNCYELVEFFYNFSHVCQKSESLLKECYDNTLNQMNMRLNFKEDGKTKLEIPVKRADILSDKLPQAVDCVTGNKIQLNGFSKSGQYVFDNSKQKLNALLARIQENQLKFTKGIHSPSQLTGHENTTNKESLHTCSQCSLQFSSPRALNFHHAAEHSKRRFRMTLRFQCKNCIRAFSDLNRLNRHYRMSHGLSKSELTEADLNSEMKQSVPVEKINFFCFHCVPHKQLQSQKQLMKHLEECHRMEQTNGSPVLHSCAHCTYATFMTRLSLNQHMLWVHKLREDEITWSDVKCVSAAQKSHPTFPKALARVNPPLPLCASQQKAKGNHPTGTLDVDSLQDKNLHSEIPYLDPTPQFADYVYSPPSEGQNRAVDSSSSSIEAWTCYECPASDSGRQFLQCDVREKHNRVNSGETKCPECSESFLTNRRLIQHGISVHQKYFAWFHHVFKKVLQPAKEEHRERNFECDICGRKYIYKSSLRKHILVGHLGKSSKDAIACPYCGKTLSNKLNLKSHVEFVHEALFVSCPICKKKINFRTIGRHYKTHRTNADGVFPESNYLCNLCGKVLKSKRSFDDHQKLHQNIRDEICDVCGSGFTTKKLLRLHKKTHEGVARKMFACDQCEKVFSGRHTLNRHLLTHSGKKNFICEICSKCFYTIQELNRHVRYHKKDYKFDCQLCDMRFLCKSRFRHHMMKHRNVRPHKCQFCDKMFIERAKMNIHMSAKHNVEVHNTKTVWKDPKTYVPLDDLL